MKQKIWIITSIFLLTFGFFSNGFSQWIQTIGADGNSVTSFAQNGANLFAGSHGGGVFLSTDDGSNWTAVNSGLSINAVTALASQGQNLFAGTAYANIYRSSDNGVSWKDVNKIIYDDIRSFAVSGTNLFAGTGGGGVYLSTDGGTTWKSSNTGITAKYINTFCLKGNYIFAGGNGLFRSSDNGKNWTSVGGIFTGTVFGLATIGTTLFAVTRDGAYFSNTNGTSWIPISTDLLSPPINTIISSGTNLFAGTFAGVFLSSDNGLSWSNVNSNLTDKDIDCFAVMGTNLFVGTFIGDVTGIWKRPLSDFGINDVKNTPQSDLNISLSPNPTTGIITVHNTSANILHVTVNSILGESVLELEHPNAPEFTLDLSKIPPGIYFARFVMAGEVVSRKIIKE
jgi:photosystem II stability/assembly factor-like uncharacterized protein